MYWLLMIDIEFLLMQYEMLPDILTCVITVHRGFMMKM